MHNKFFNDVIQEILKEDKKSLPWVPPTLNQTWEVQAGIAGAIAGALAGGAIGLHLGIAGAFGAIVGTIPCALVGGVIGYFSGAKIGSKVQKDLPKDYQNYLTKPALSSATKEYLGIDSSRCPYCGEPKSKWWDSSQNRCGKCKQPV
jgi:hypothetical protein